MYFDRKRGRRKISLVPMIDVLLCLLIFFMITSKFIYFNQIEISSNNGESKTKNASEDGDEPIYIKIVNKNNIEYLGQQYALSELLNLLETNVLSSLPLSKKEELPVVITISNSTRLQDFVSLMESLQSENLHNFQLRKVHV